MITRRNFGFLAGASLAGFTLSATGLSRPLRAEEGLKEFHIGFQKAGLLVLAKQQQSIEKHLADAGIAVTWVEFPSGPPLLEALNVGSIDFGFTGDAPPIFAQAAGANLVYVAAAPGNGQGEAIVVKDGSLVKTVADLKGKRVAVTKGSSAHNLLVVALEKAGVAFSDVTPVYLSPADAAAAFSSDQVDAWSIWDPFLALAEGRDKLRTVAISADTHKVNTYFLANRKFADAHPKVIADSLAGLADAAAWASANRGAAAKGLSDITGVPLPAEELAVGRAAYGIFPLDEQIIAGQQATADRFYKLGLIPKAIVVKDIAWNPPKA